VLLVRNIYATNTGHFSYLFLPNSLKTKNR